MELREGRIEEVDERRKARQTTPVLFARTPILKFCSCFEAVLCLFANSESDVQMYNRQLPGGSMSDVS